MAKELHIKIDDVIGSFYDDFGFLYVGFMAFMLEGILEANPDATKITIHADCPGGDIIEGYRIYNRLEEFKRNGGTVEFINEAMCASMITVIAQAATPGMRYAYPASTWLMHKPLYSELRCVNANDLRKLAFELDNFEETILNIFISASGNAIEVVKTHIEEDIFISSDEAVRRGYLDKVIEAAGNESPKKTEAKAVAFYNPSNIDTTNNLTKPSPVMSKTKEPSPLAKLKAAIISAFSEVEEPQNAVTTTATDKGDLFHDGELAENTAVFSDEAMTTPAADGTYTLTDDGRIVTVAAGIVTKIEDAPADPANSKELEAANAKIAELESQLAAQNAKVTEVINTLNAKEQVINSLNAKLNTVPGKTTTAKPVQNHAVDAPVVTEPSKEVKAFSALKKK